MSKSLPSATIIETKRNEMAEASDAPLLTVMSFTLLGFRVLEAAVNTSANTSAKRDGLWFNGEF